MIKKIKTTLFTVAIATLFSSSANAGVLENSIVDFNNHHMSRQVQEVGTSSSDLYTCASGTGLSSEPDCYRFGPAGDSYQPANCLGEDIAKPGVGYYQGWTEMIRLGGNVKFSLDLHRTSSASANTYYVLGLAGYGRDIDPVSGNFIFNYTLAVNFYADGSIKVHEIHDGNTVTTDLTGPTIDQNVTRNLMIERAGDKFVVAGQQFDAPTFLLRPFFGVGKVGSGNSSFGANWANVRYEYDSITSDGSGNLNNVRQLNATACSDDIDEDEIVDLEDNCPNEYNNLQADSDGNGLGFWCDCPEQISSASQALPSMVATEELARYNLDLPYWPNTLYQCLGAGL